LSKRTKIVLFAVAAVLVIGFVVLPLLTMKVTVAMPGEAPKTVVDFSRK